MTKTISVTVKDEIWDLAKEKGIKWSEAIEKGIVSIANEEVIVDFGEKIAETTLKNELEQLKRANHKMQDHILKISERLQ